jgi:SAM-dependent methyltransferase
LAEFTGERVIPGQVADDLWNEHAARYAFAARLAKGRRVLDAGCGSGYGAARLAMQARSVVGVDLASEAVEYARQHYAMPNLAFLQASCTQLPVADAAFELVVAFEVIEHLADWPAFLEEMRRVTAPGGLFVVSTPNKAYYGASRGPSEPNPYHLHEFDYQEFRAELAARFPHVTMALQNHAGGIVFQPVETYTQAEAWVESGAGGPQEAHFFVAVCSLTTSVAVATLVYIPRAANILREREIHIERLEGELDEKTRRLEETLEDRRKLVEMFRQQTGELEERNRWAQELDARLGAVRKRIADVQQELAEQQAAARQMAAGYEAKVQELEEESRRRAEWAQETERRLGRELEERAQELAECARLLERAEATVEERTRWAQRLEEELRQAEALLSMARASRWMKLGRAVGLGPRLGNG